ncbi:tetratricopeptide repeat protein [Cylindrospermum stagnale PCC 7417]|uniref:Tetratricopeptide repeat protein n=1 Tax=Cylindrospermum stagnale PCC 7417 TaxID=56107 RepID=K9WTN0_9NOST|nr:CHAT domain-containing protein [Cylindrospermum stagnale]AFZ23745.1 tetratricopeptide repeat protein [Cylindrospermum stagnale PCC 7417]
MKNIIHVKTAIAISATLLNLVGISYPIILHTPPALAQNSGEKDQIVEQMALAKALFEEGEALFKKADYASAVEALEPALKLLVKLESSKEAQQLAQYMDLAYFPDRIWKITMFLGVAHAGLGNYKKSIDYNLLHLLVTPALIEALQNYSPYYNPENFVIKIRQNEVDIVNRIGLNYQSLGSYKKAIEHHNIALSTAQKIKYPTGEFDAFIRLSKAYINLNDNTKATNYAEQGLALARQIEDREAEAEALGQFQKIYTSLKDYNKAVEYGEQSLAIARQLTNSIDKIHLLRNISYNYISLGKNSKAIEYQEQSFAIATQIGGYVECLSLANKGDFYHSLGDHAQAIEYSQKALKIALDFRNPLLEDKANKTLGNTYFSLGDYKKAIEYYQKKLVVAQQRGNPEEESSTLLSLAKAYLELRNYNQAIKLAQQSLGIAKKHNYRENEELALQLLGNTYIGLGDFSKAIEYQQNTLANSRQLKQPDREYLALEQLGVIYHEQGNYSKAIDYYQQSLNNRRNSQKVDPEQWKILSKLGSAFAEAGNFSQAQETLQDSVRSLEYERRRLGTNDSDNLTFFEQQVDTYRTLQKVFIAQNQPQAALEIAERGRTRVLVDLLATRLFATQATPITLSPPSIAQIRQIAQQQNATLVEYSIINQSSGFRQQKQASNLYIWVIKPTGEVIFRQVDLKSLKAPLKDLVSQTRELINEGRGRGKNNNLTLLPGNLVKLQGDADDWQPWEIVSTNVSAQTITIKRPDNPEAPPIIRPIKDVVSQVESRRSNHPSLQQLHQLLIQPIADLLPNDPNSRVIFIPQDELFLVPFAALQDAQGNFLVEKHTILTAPAIQILDLTRQRRGLNRKDKSALVVGNPTMPKVSLVPGEPPQQLSALPEAEKEAQLIAQMLGTKALIGNQATKATVVSQLPKVSIIHLATHGLLDDRRGLGSSIALAPDVEKQEGNGLLTADEILNLQLNAELVVLSACNTGTGEITGDGVIGLSRSLISAGVASVLVSLWTVPDAPTASLMTEFYRNWQQQPDKAATLRQAMLATMKQYPHPRDWAAFTIIGEAE